MNNDDGKPSDPSKLVPPTRRMPSAKEPAPTRPMGEGHARASEMGVLETIGLTKMRLGALITLESVSLGLLGGVIGAGAVAAYFTFWPTTLGVEGYGIDFRASTAVVLHTLAASLVVGIVAALGPAIETARRPLATAVKAD